MSKSQTSNLLPQAILDKIDKALTKYPEDQKQSAVKTALHLAQAHNKGWLTQELMDEVADYLDMPSIAVYEVATFYAHFNIVKNSETFFPIRVIRVCESLTCELFGAQKLLKEIKTIKNKNIKVVPGPCMGRC